MIPNQWPTEPKDKKKRASARLRIVINALAYHATGKTSIRQLANHIKLDHSTLCIYIRAGAFSIKCAKLLEDTFGKERAPLHFFIDPLNYTPEQ